MIKIRRSRERGHANYDWLDTYHTFSFNDYYDPQFVNFRSLRVINEDRVAAGKGFGTHGHSDMEILTFVVSGALAHADSTGGEETLRPHEVQRMTAGTSIRHSEFNPSTTEATHLYQIWILPETEGLPPGYEQTRFAPEEKTGKLKLVASCDAREGSVKINQDVSVYSSILSAGAELEHRLGEKRHAWLQVVKGSLALGNDVLKAGDGAAVSDEKLLQLKAGADAAEFLLFDLA